MTHADVEAIDVSCSRPDDGLKHIRLYQPVVAARHVSKQGNANQRPQNFRPNTGVAGTGHARCRNDFAFEHPFLPFAISCCFLSLIIRIVKLFHSVIDQLPSSCLSVIQKRLLRLSRRALSLGS